MKMKTIGAAVALSLGLAGAANAALINAIDSGGSAALVSTTTVFQQGDVLDVSDGDVGTIADYGNNGQIFTNDPGAGGGDYFAQAAEAIIFDIDLGNTYAIDAIAFWNRGLYGGNSVRTFTATFSTDSVFGNGDDSQLFTFNAAEGVGPDQQDFDLGTLVSNAQYVQISITDNFFGVNGAAGGDRVNFSEFQFNAVPEPSSAALLGLGGLAMILRRRK
ncbi:PEP-CTERM sorting domain-containing protein [Sulfuriroseicoccus oceanibius]|uniref:PEP-CTERM sorting domain-containing protein n=1 Tax=Sulfuriroseicoccus oceanibius TaxID=2707525 RepID=A0A6B3L6I9_9BACT|nr:PEP-CTERM sorting domain-containing protein [Sulfuriroseicoccus oceanibius]QQL43674.1 PEP-CTERM sorting domain-containing protein [Sulfuriroseicoccus oceanibius]